MVVYDPPWWSMYDDIMQQCNLQMIDLPEINRSTKTPTSNMNLDFILLMIG